MDTCNKISNNYLFKYWISIATIRLINKGWKPRLWGMTLHGKHNIPQINLFNKHQQYAWAGSTSFPGLEEAKGSPSSPSFPGGLLALWLTKMALEACFGLETIAFPHHPAQQSNHKTHHSPVKYVSLKKKKNFFSQNLQGKFLIHVLETLVS